MSESNELRVSIPSQSLDEIAAHAFACFPEECCGLLVGDRGTNTTVRFVPSTNVAHSAKVYTIDPKEHLRAELAARGVDGFLIPRADEHQGEYVPKRAERLAWLTGFTGSAGTAIVLTKKAAVFVDGRYTLQVGEQVDVKIFSPIAVAEISPEQWLERQVSKGAVIGYDPALHTRAQVKRFAAAC